MPSLAIGAATGTTVEVAADGSLLEWLGGNLSINDDDINYAASMMIFLCKTKQQKFGASILLQIHWFST